MDDEEITKPDLRSIPREVKEVLIRKGELPYEALKGAYLTAVLLPKKRKFDTQINFQTLLNRVFKAAQNKDLNLARPAIDALKAVDAHVKRETNEYNQKRKREALVSEPKKKIKGPKIKGPKEPLASLGGGYFATVPVPAAPTVAAPTVAAPTVAAAAPAAAAPAAAAPAAAKPAAAKPAAAKPAAKPIKSAAPKSAAPKSATATATAATANLFTAPDPANDLQYANTVFAELSVNDLCAQLKTLFDRAGEETTKQVMAALLPTMSVAVRQTARAALNPRELKDRVDKQLALDMKARFDSGDLQELTESFLDRFTHADNKKKCYKQGIANLHAYIDSTTERLMKHDDHVDDDDEDASGSSGSDTDSEDDSSDTDSEDDSKDSEEDDDSEDDEEEDDEEEDDEEEDDEEEDEEK